MLPEYCPVCSAQLVPTTFDKEGAIFAVGLGCQDLHYSKVVGSGVASEVVDGEWFSCHMAAPMVEKVEWQKIINRAVFKACRKYQKGQPKLAFLE